MKKVMVFAVAIALAGMTGCASRHADVPTPTRFANENQQKLQSARHWQLIAEHFAGQVAESIGGNHYTAFSCLPAMLTYILGGIIQTGMVEVGGNLFVN